MRELESGARVIVEATHQTVVQGKSHADRIQDFLYLLEMLAARFVEKLADARQLLNNGLVLRNFAVEHTQRICDRASLAIRVHLSYYRLQGLAQGFVVDGAILGAAD